MRTFNLLPGLFAASLIAAPALALDGKTPPSASVASAMPTGAFKSVRDAFRSGIQDYNAGDKLGAARALEYAAGQGHALANWKLGRMYADGDGVPRSDIRAFEHFSQIADGSADESPDSANARLVASAFVAVGTYLLDGIPGSSIRANPARSRDLFHYAASYFGDPDAQYSLARLHLDGVGGPKDPRQATRWLHLAADKGHVRAQALLGHLLFTGEGGSRQRARGLMWLTLARDAATRERDAWIVDLHDKAMRDASPADREVALVYLEQYLKRRP